jgi:hypothetical protein
LVRVQAGEQKPRSTTWAFFASAAGGDLVSILTIVQTAACPAAAAVPVTLSAGSGGRRRGCTGAASRCGSAPGAPCVGPRVDRRLMVGPSTPAPDGVCRTSCRRCEGGFRAGYRRRRVLSMTSEGPDSVAGLLSADAFRCAARGGTPCHKVCRSDLAMTADELVSATDGYGLGQREQRW